MDNKKNDEYYVNQILDDLTKISSYTSNVSYEEFLSDELMIDAVLFRLILVTESIKKLSLQYRKSKSIINWNDIIGFRNRIVHDYGKTDYSIVYEVVTNDIPRLKEALTK